MSTRYERNLSDQAENLCVVCFKNVEIYSIGICDHPVCFECSTRMRVLCCQNECPICRGDMPKVIFTRQIEPFSVMLTKYERTNNNNNKDLEDRKYGMLFGSGAIQKAYQYLLEYRCDQCRDAGRNKYLFGHFTQLKDHMRREHSLSYCDLCVENLKIFCFERRCYTRQELGYHRRKGDPDNTSHRGHPLCEFCDTRFMDSDELFRHLRRNHLFCHFCDADGKHQYYNSMDDLKKHFKDEHYLCEEDDCRNMALTAVFRTDIDLKAHITSEHRRNMSKSATKQARTLELEFTLAPRQRSNDLRNKRGGNSTRMERFDDEGAVGYDLEPNLGGGPGGGGIKQTNNTNLFVNPLTSNDFPALGNSTVTVQGRPSTKLNFASKSNAFSGNDFPSLRGSNNNGSRVPATQQAVTITTSTSSSPSAASALSSSSNSGRNNISNRSKPPEVTIIRTVRGNNNNNQNLMKNAQNFPNLSSSSSNNSNTSVRLSVNNSQQNAPKLSIQVNHNSNGAVTTHITSKQQPLSDQQFYQLDNLSKADAFPALNAAASTKSSSTVVQPQKQQALTAVKWVQQKPKKMTTQLENSNKLLKVAPAPQLPPSDLTQFPQLSSKTANNNTNKNNKTNKSTATSVTVVPLSNSWVSSNSNKQVISKDDEKVINNEENNTNNNKQNNNKSSKKKKAKNIINNNDTITSSTSALVEQRNNKTSDTINNSNTIKTDENKNNNNNNLNNKLSMNNGTIKKRSELKIGTLSLNKPDDTDDKIKPPPGFTGTVKPPPGFNTTNCQQNFPSLSASSSDLTFTNSSGQSYAIQPPTNGTNNNYYLPPLFAQRNQNLIKSFLNALNNNDLIISEFKQYSVLFRNGSMPANEYYQHCQAVLGASFDDVFPELLVLLPDIEKQQELYRVYNNNNNNSGGKGKTNGTSSSDNLIICANCLQVIFKNELTDHYKSHQLDSQFPSLGAAGKVTGSSNAWRK